MGTYIGLTLMDHLVEDSHVAPSVTARDCFSYIRKIHANTREMIEPQHLGGRVVALVPSPQMDVSWAYVCKAPSSTWQRNPVCPVRCYLLSYLMM
jgi:hypothetical protein